MVSTHTAPNHWYLRVHCWASSCCARLDMHARARAPAGPHPSPASDRVRLDTPCTSPSHRVVRVHSLVTVHAGSTGRWGAPRWAGLHAQQRSLSTALTPHAAPAEHCLERVCRLVWVRQRRRQRSALLVHVRRGFVCWRALSGLWLRLRARWHWPMLLWRSRMAFTGFGHEGTAESVWLACCRFSLPHHCQCWEACVLGCVAVDGAASHGCGAAVAGVRLVTVCVLLLTWLCCCVACTQHWVCRCAAGRQVGGSRQHMCPRRETELCCCFDALVSLLNGSLLRHTLQCCLMHVAAGAVHMEEQGHARQGALFGSHAGGSQRTTSAGCWGAGWMVCVSVCCYVSCVRVQLTLGPGTLGT